MLRSVVASSDRHPACGFIMIMTALLTTIFRSLIFTNLTGPDGISVHIPKELLRSCFIDKGVYIGTIEMGLEIS